MCRRSIILCNYKLKLVYLEKRVICLPVWWFIGSQIWPDEPELSGALRHLKLKTSLEAEPSRLHFVRINRYLHSGPPCQPAHDNFTCTFSLNASNAEIRQAVNHLDPAEYDTALGLKAFTRTYLREAKIAQPIVDIYDQLFPANG